MLAPSSIASLDGQRLLTVRTMHLRWTARVLALLLASAYAGKRRGFRRRRTGADAVEAVTTAATGETVDPLGYYRYSWTAPTDACGTEMHADLDGTRVWNWGLDKKEHVASAAACCAKCQSHPRCTSWVFCPEPVCFAPDVHKHTLGECWMKQQRDPAAPSVNMRGAYTDKYRGRAGHHHAPPLVHWISGTIRVTRPRTNGTWSGRAVW